MAAYDDVHTTNNYVIKRERKDKDRETDADKHS